MNAHLLIAEPDAMTARLLAFLLADAGYRATPVADPRRALPALAAATKVWRDLFPDAMGLCRDGHAFIKKSTGTA